MKKKIKIKSHTFGVWVDFKVSTFNSIQTFWLGEKYPNKFKT